MKLVNKPLALFVKGLGQYVPHGLAKRSGFQKDDILIEIDGIKNRLPESELLGRLLSDPKGRHPLSITLLRNKKRLALTLPIETEK